MTRHAADIFVTALIKGPDRYVLLYTAATRAEALRTLGRWASEPELDFTWYDAVTLSQRIREEMDL
jgi:hypothetical protein